MRDTAIDRARRVLEDVGLVPVTPAVLAALGELYDTAWLHRGRHDAAVTEAMQKLIEEAHATDGSRPFKVARIRG